MEAGPSISNYRTLQPVPEMMHHMDMGEHGVPHWKGCAINSPGHIRSGLGEMKQEAREGAGQHGASRQQRWCTHSLRAVAPGQWVWAVLSTAGWGPRLGAGSPGVRPRRLPTELTSVNALTTSCGREFSRLTALGPTSPAPSPSWAWRRRLAPRRGLLPGTRTARLCWGPTRVRLPSVHGQRDRGGQGSRDPMASSGEVGAGGRSPALPPAQQNRASFRCVCSARVARSPQASTASSLHTQTCPWTCTRTRAHLCMHMYTPHSCTCAHTHLLHMHVHVPAHLLHTHVRVPRAPTYTFVYMCTHPHL